MKSLAFCSEAYLKQKPVPLNARAEPIEEKPKLIMPKIVLFGLRIRRK